MTYSKMHALRSQRAAFSPAAYGPSACSISSIAYTPGSDSTRWMARIMASRSEGSQLAAGVEEVAIQARLRRRLELRQVEVNALAAVGLRAPGVEEREGCAQDGGGDGRAVDADVRLVQVESALPMHEERQLALGDTVLPVALAIGVGQLAIHGGQSVVGRAHAYR